MSHRVGSAFCYHILKYNWEIESRTTVQHVTQDVLDTPVTKTSIDTFNVNVAEQLNNDNFKLKEKEVVIYDDVDDVNDNNNLGCIEASDWNMNHADKRDDHNDDEFDLLFSAEMLLPNESADGFIQEQ